MEILLGKNKWKTEEIIKWESNKLINGHMIIVGASGTGKTYRLREFINKLKNQNSNIRFHILDVHGDIEVDNCSSVKFSEITNYGLNPLIISDDHDFGGVRKRIRAFISTLNRTSRQLGSKQESVLINILYDLYEASGFYSDDVKTWKLDYDPISNRKFKKRHPNVTDLRKFAEYKLKQMVAGGGAKAIEALEELNKKISTFNRINQKAVGKDPEIYEEKIGKLKENCKEIYNEYIDNIKTGHEIDEIIKYDSKEVIKSVYERLVNLESSGIFKGETPPFDENNNVWRYNIKSLNKDEQKMFIDILLEDIFINAKQVGEKNEPETFIIIDEAHIFLTDEDEHIINVIAKEARKFGVALILASQSFTHFPEDIISNASTKIVLGIDEMFHIGSAKKLMIEPKRFGYIIPQKSALIQLKNKGDMSNKYMDVILS